MAKKQKTQQAKDDPSRAFLKVFRELCQTQNSWQVWADFVELTANSISCAFDKVQMSKRMERNEAIKARYKDGGEMLAQMFALTVEALEENPDQDFLGQMFMMLELSNHWKGQFFTPYCLCEMMAKMQLFPEEGEGSVQDGIKEHGFVSINDPACGAGALLVAARNEMRRVGIDWPTQALFVAQDIDRIAGMMCYIQISLLGCAGYVVIADTLTNPLTTRNGDPLAPVVKEGQEIWFTPALFSETWCWRMVFRSLLDQIGDHRKMNGNEGCEEKPAEMTVEMKGGQMAMVI